MDKIAVGVDVKNGRVVKGVNFEGLKDMADPVAARVKVPIIASGGAGKMQDFAELFRHKGIDAGLAAGIFHTKAVQIPDLKAYLRAQGIEMRL